MESNDSCSICTEKYNKSNRLSIACICDNTCCRTCAKRYIESKFDEAHCLFCKNRWNRDFLIQHFEKKYIANEYKTYRENLLFERELSLLPLTQPYVENQLRSEAIHVEIRGLEKQRNDLNGQISQMYIDAQQLRDKKNVEKRKYVRKCPKNECQGFLSSQLKCELCSSWVCSECREIKGDEKNSEHTCNPEILESIKFLSNDTKNCPSCSAMIYRIEGCSQMFCTECHSAFDWNTLRIVNGAIHNPHYFEWQRRTQNGQTGEPGQPGCRRDLNHATFTLIQNKIMQEYNLVETMTNDTIEKMLDNAIKNEQSKRRLENPGEPVREFDVALRKLQSRIHSITHSNLFSSNKFLFTKECLSAIIELTRSNAAINEFVDNMRYTFYNRRIDQISNIVQRTIHIREIELPRWENADRINNNLDLRIFYMRNKISKEEFKATIQKRNKIAERNTEYTNILRMYVNCMGDLIYRIEDNIDVYKEVLAEMHELRKYTNEHMAKIFVCYGSSMKHNINDKFAYAIHHMEA